MGMKMLSGELLCWRAIGFVCFLTQEGKMSGELSSSIEIKRTLSRSTWYAGLPEALKDWLIANAQLRRLQSGDRLLARGDAPDGLYCMCSGLLRLTGTTEAGQETILAVVGAPHWFGEIALFDGEPRTHDAWAQTDALLVHIAQKKLEKLLADNPGYWRHFGQLLTQKLRSTYVLVEDLLSLPPTPRIAHRLIEISTGYHTLDGSSRRVVRVTQEHLAAMLALSRQTVNLALRELETMGTIKRSRSAIELVDLAQLKLVALDQSG